MGHSWVFEKIEKGACVLSGALWGVGGVGGRSVIGGRRVFCGGGCRVRRRR